MVVHRHSLKALGPMHPPRVTQLGKTAKAMPVKIRVKDPLDHYAPAILHKPPDFDASRAKGAAVVLISGAGGGVSGPSGMYPSLADKFASLLSIPCMRLDYRQPAESEYCTADVLASFNHLETNFSSSKFVIVGWSFGGSPCFTVGGLRDPEKRVRGVATVASQTAGTAGIGKMNPRPVMLLHGTGDSCLSPVCSERLYRGYGTGGNAELHLFEGDDHGLSQNAVEAERMIFDFAAKCLGFEQLRTDERTEELAAKDLAGSQAERMREMETGHDLEGGERL